MAVIAGAGLSCTKNHPGTGAPKTFVIVPRAWSGPYAWDSVKANLEKSGNKAVVVQLPGVCRRGCPVNRSGSAGFGHHGYGFHPGRQSGSFGGQPDSWHRIRSDH